jgi:hypothetical protein
LVSIFLSDSTSSCLSIFLSFYLSVIYHLSIIYCRVGVGTQDLQDKCSTIELKSQSWLHILLWS